MKTTPDQLSLPLFDTTALTSSMGLYSGLSFGEPIDDSIAETEEDAPRAGRCSCAELPSHRRPPPRPRLEDARGGQHRRHPIDAPDRGGGAERDRGRAGTPRALHVFRRRRPCEQPLPPIRRGSLPQGLGDPRGGPRAARLAGRAREPRARHAIRAFHPGIHGAGHVARVAPHGLLRRSRPRARMRDRPLLRPHARSPGGQDDADRRRNGPGHGSDREAPPSERAHPRRGLHQGAHRRDLRPRHRQPAVQQPHRPRRRSCRPAQPVAPRLFHRAVDRAATAGRPRGLRHQPLDHGQGRSDGPHVSRLHGRSRRRRPPARRRHARGGRNRSRRRHPVLPEARTG